MKKRGSFLRFAKKTLAFVLATTTFAVNGYGLDFKRQVNIEAEAATATADLLPDDERGIIYADSRTDFRDESIYFVIVTRFYDGDPGNNVRTSEDDNKAHNPEDDPSWRGDFAGLIEKLDYIKALGFTAIWITPVVQNDSGYDYHGYHAYNFSAVDTRYESNGVTYQDLIDAVHAKGMKLIQDVVLNHTCNWGEENLLQITDPVYAGGRSEVVASGKYDTENIYHHNGFCGGSDWDNYAAQNKTIADDCFDLETENPRVYNYLVDCYTKYINMGVDAFRVDTVKHISRLTFNSVFVPAFKKAGGDNFYMFGEVCTKGHDVWYRGQPGISTCFYTWADTDAWLNRWSNDLASNEALVEEHYTAHGDTSNQPTSDNAFLNGNEYHTPDYSEKSGMDVIDFQMHWSFYNANSAFNMALQEDKYFNDSTWNVVYVDSHDYAPDECQTVRYTGGTDAWAENLSLMFTFRGIPCVYYGSEVEFQKGKPIDVGPSTQLANTGRAYYGDYMEGDLTAVDFTVFGDVNGTVQDTLSAPLSQHIMRLNRLRQAIPALRKGQYSVDGCSGNMAFKRRYTDSTTDSFCLVAISGDATFTGIPNGKYVDAVTGDIQNVTNGTLKASVSGKGNMKVYVLDTAKTPAPGRVIYNGTYLTDGGTGQLIGPVDINVIEPTSITLNKSSVSLLEGNTETVTATIAPSNATKKTVTWTTSDAAVAKVSGGTITGVAPGTATITAKTTNGLTATVRVTVSTNPNIVKPSGITLSQSAITLTEGDTETVTATVTPSNAANKTVTWESADTAIATVSSSGTIKAVAEGTTTITASTFNGYSAKVTVTVEAKTVPVIENGVYFEKPSNWGDTIYAYMWNNNTGEQILGAWPGTEIQKLQDNIYGFSSTETEDGTMIIFNDNSSKTDDLKFYRNGYYDVSGFVKVVADQGKVIVNYVDEDGNVLASQTIKGEIGSSYTTSAKTIDGYTLKTTPSNATGTYTKENITVTYVYKKNVTTLTGKLKVNGSTGTLNLNKGDSVTLVPTATGGTGSYTYQYLMKTSVAGSNMVLKNYSSATSYTGSLTSAGTKIFTVNVKDSAGTVVATNSVTVVVTAGNALSASLRVNGQSGTINLTKGGSVTLTPTATGGSGTYTYQYLMKTSATGSNMVLKNYSSATSYTGPLTSTGTKVFTVNVKDSTGTVVATNSVTVVVSASPTLSASLKVNGATGTISLSKGGSVTLVPAVSGGSGTYTYQYLMKTSATGSNMVLKNYSSATSYTGPLVSTGTKIFTVNVKDSSGKIVATNSVTVVVSASPTLSASLKVNGATGTISLSKGGSVTLVPAVSGGSGTYTYQYLMKTSAAGSNMVLKNYSSATSYTGPLVSTGTKIFTVNVKDSSGKIVATNSVTVVVK